MEAAADYATAASLGADRESVSVCRAALLLDRGHPEAALDTLAAIHRAAWVPALRLCARAHTDLARPAQAAACFRQVIDASKHPRPEDYLDLATAHEDAGDPAAALRALDSGIAALGPVPSLVYPAVDLETAQGRPDAALERLDALDDSPTTLARRGDVLAGAGRTLAAQAAYTEALDRLDALPPSRRHTPALTALAARLGEALSVTRLPDPEEQP